ncbi:hypothetical protein Y032_0110g193 [Ancylostoma ceylanicum]|uniref:Uncharacterized protein n=1 Tax=Ancylostoma ceylanicum TaxID=53326 RepID=A0A016TDY5_9BILA|nr:hypothetical protein Y032_0110g193 [Ancylostoma ceylanicum]
MEQHEESVRKNFIGRDIDMTLDSGYMESDAVITEIAKLTCSNFNSGHVSPHFGRRRTLITAVDPSPSPTLDAFQSENSPAPGALCIPLPEYPSPGTGMPRGVPRHAHLSPATPTKSRADCPYYRRWYILFDLTFRPNRRPQRSAEVDLKNL